jgi:hypothetical protein
MEYIEIPSEKGPRSPCLVIVGDENGFQAGANTALLQHFSILLVKGIDADPRRVIEYAESISDELSVRKIKRAGILGLGLGASIAQAIAARTSRFIRRVILIDALTRVSPSQLEKCMDRIEKTLPLGLPLRSLSSDYDSRPELHRIQCPVLALRTPQADTFLDSQFDLISRRIPNCWKKKLSDPIHTDANDYSEELIDLLIQFEEVPAKSPQKML